ncbi:MAG: N-6 DNA methylase [Bacteroidota bacterium]|nr:N-6 DNA methylase [Bacteroidota bacterium]MDP4236967.1 N-6 DNA methylase [Bacteroidota bacterium]
MKSENLDLIQKYYHAVRKANKEYTKKELFKDLLHRLYSGVKEIDKTIDAISAGAEYAIINIPRKDKKHKGSADTLYNQIIIEFENNLKLNYRHAKEQLAGYLLGQFSVGEGYNYTLIASDFINWKVVAPDVSQIDKLKTLTEDELILNDVADASFTLTEDNSEDFYYWIDRFLFREEKQKATLKRIEGAFGSNSRTFLESIRHISTIFKEVREAGEVQVSYEQWRKFLSVAYGSFDDSDSAFVIHTYLSVLAKVLAYEVLSNDDYVEDSEMKAILDGSIFYKYNIRNFVDNDFFHWVHSDNHFQKLKKTFRLIAQEMSTFDFDQVDEDVLKGVYQDLIDLDTRHALGEYYTPDWLCERVVEEYNFTKDERILDPSCGSGSFLRAAIHRLRLLSPEITVDEINDCITGIDIHPLSVQIAKTTVLVSLGKDIINANRPIHINVILANTLLAPEGVSNLFGGEFQMNIDKDRYFLNTKIFEDVRLFDEALDVCETLAESTKGQEVESLPVFESILRKQNQAGGLSDILAESFYKIYTGLKKVKEDGRDSIWKFIVQNLYKPYFLNRRFDYVIGNPPWFTYGSIKNEEYQKLLNSLAEKYNVKPAKVANYPNLEIAAIFLSYCSSYFLRDGGKLAFVLPRSFFSADHHDNTRSGRAKGFRLTSIWDLDQVAPLFRVPSAVLFAERAIVGRKIPTKGLPGKVFKGRIPEHNCNWKLAQAHLTEGDVQWYYLEQGASSAFSTQKRKSSTKVNPYKKGFKRGAEMTPRNFYFIELTQERPPDLVDRIINVRTSESIRPESKKPWKGHYLEGRIESRFIFRTALAKSILPFALYKPDLIVLPIMISEGEKARKISRLLSASDLRREGYLHTAQWFQQAERIWDEFKTAKNKNITAIDYLNWNNKLLSQNLNSKYIVIYNSSAKDANAAILPRSIGGMTFFVDTKAYAFYVDDVREALYLTAILNSSITNVMMKEFQSRGLYGARDVHKKILDIYFPKFDSTDEKHLLLASLSRIASRKAKAFLAQTPPNQVLSANRLGRLRLDIKKVLAEEIGRIDLIVKKIIA